MCSGEKCVVGIPNTQISRYSKLNDDPSTTMKFRCKIGKEALLILIGVTNTLSKISDSNSATIVLNEDNFRFSVLSAQDTTHPRCYAELSTTALFLEYRIESQSANTIIFQISLGLLAKALSSGRQAHASVLKLVKRDNKPFLSFESAATASVANFDICHDIPIKLIHISDLQWLSPPVVPPPVVALELPAGKALKALLDKLNRFSRTVIVHGQQAGRLGFKLDEVTSGVGIRCFVHQLRPYQIPDSQQEHEQEDNASMRVMVRHLSMALDHFTVPTAQALLFMAGAREAMVLHVKLQPEQAGALTYYLPSLPLEDEAEEEGDGDGEGEGKEES